MKTYRAVYQYIIVVDAETAWEAAQKTAIEIANDLPDEDIVNELTLVGVEEVTEQEEV